MTRETFAADQHEANERGTMVHARLYFRVVHRDDASGDLVVESIGRKPTQFHIPAHRAKRLEPLVVGESFIEGDIRGGVVVQATPLQEVAAVTTRPTNAPPIVRRNRGPSRFPNRPAQRAA